MNETNGWSAYEKLVLSRINAIEHDIQTLDEKLTMLRIDVAQLKVKAGVWGAAAGMIPAVITALAIFVAGGPT